MEIYFGKLVGNLDRNLDEILILGILDLQKLVWKFTLEIQMKIQFGKLVGNLDRNLDGIFYPWNFGSLEISMQIYFGNLDENLV